MADFSKRIPGCDDDCDGEGGERGERGKRGKRGKRGHDGHDGRDGTDGATGPTGPSEGVVVDPTPPTLTGNGTDDSPLKVINVAAQPLIPLGTVITIHARIFGNDETGDGSIANPYRTLPRAMLDVPLFIPPNLRYVVDVTGLGIETLPDDYATPPITTAAVIDFDFANPFIVPALPLTIFAEPQLLSSIPAEDAVINPGDILSDDPDPNTGLRTITLTAPRASWAANALKGAFAVGSLDGFDNGVVHVSSANTIQVTTGEALTAPIRIMEPSTTFTGNVPGFGFRGVLSITETGYVSLVGLGVRPPPGVGLPGLFVNNTSFAICQLCQLVDADFERGEARPMSTWLAADALGGLFMWQESTVIDKCLIEGGMFILDPNMYIITNCVTDGVAGVGAAFNGRNEPCTVDGQLIAETLVRNAPGDGVLFQGGRSLLRNVTINGSQGNAILAFDGQGFLDLVSVQGTGNAGLGLLANGGVQVRADAATDVNGTLKSGDLPATTWANLPQYDIIAVSPAGAIGTGTRIYPA